MNTKFDDIYIWSRQEIRSIKYKKNIKVDTENIGTIFNSIFVDVKSNHYLNKIILIQKNMKIHRNFITLINEILYPKNYQVLLLGVIDPIRYKKYDRIISLGSFIINLKETDINKFNWRLDYGYPNSIYSASKTVFLHPKQYYQIAKVSKYKNISIDSYISIDVNLFYYTSNKLIITNYNPFYYITNQIHVSPSLSKFEKRIMSTYNLVKYNNIYKPALFFGIYKLSDVDKLKKHKGNIYILWGGSDANVEIPFHKKIIDMVRKIKIAKHYSISVDLSKRLQQLGFDYTQIQFDITDYNLFKPTYKKGNNIYVYNGDKSGREDLYGREIYSEIEKRFPEFNFIYSVGLNKKYEEMPRIYSNCFIGLRLTKHDGNANTVQEMNAMNIPVVHNGEHKLSLSWENIDDVELRIRYRNIDLFNQSIEIYKNILFICSDYPGYGGAATNTYQMLSYYRNLEKNVFGIFFTLNKTDFYDKDIDIIKPSNLIKNLKRMKFIPDLVILRNYIKHDLKTIFSCPIYFLIPGIFEPHLDKYYYQIKPNEMEKYIQSDVIITIKNSDKSFCASEHTCQILKKYCISNKKSLNSNNFKIDILYFNYIPYHHKLIKNEHKERKYDYGIIVSDFDRGVKNIDNLINQLKQTKSKCNIILIGKNSDKYKCKRITCIGLIKHDQIIEYMKNIKYILQDSFYESCSNVCVEARFCGCQILKHILQTDYRVDQTELENVKVKRITKNKIKITNNYIDYNNLSIKILVTSTQYPYYGGSATCAYHSINYLRKLGFRCFGIFFDNTKQINIDPDNIGDVIQINHKIGFELKQNKMKSIIRDKVIEKLGGYPDIIFSWNYGAPILTRSIFDQKIVYVITGIPTLTLGDNSAVNNNLSINKVLQMDKYDYVNKKLLKIEEQCINNSDICLPYTKLIGDIYKLIHSNYISKLKPFLNTAIGNIVENTPKFNLDKQYDLIAVSSNWYRKVKNLNFLLEIYSKFPDLQKIIIGLDGNTKSNADRLLWNKANEMKNMTIHPLIKYDQVQKYISQSKIIVIPSYSESGPNVAIEALIQHCQVITSSNIGFFNYLNEYNICQDVYDISEYQNKITYIINNFDSLNLPDLTQYLGIEKNNNLKFIYNNITPAIKRTVMFICCDIPNIGGAATNTYNLLKLFKNSDIKCYGIFISNIEGNNDPDDIGNIYVIKITNNLERDFTQIFNKIENENKIDIIFYKNYKVFCYTHHLIKNKIKIYSPSGLRYLTNQISKQKKWFLDFDLSKMDMIPSSNIKLNTSKLLKSIKKYDAYLENYVYQNCDLIIPNSYLTYSIIKSINKYQKKLQKPIYLTNINYILKKIVKKFNQRYFDVAFIAYDWSRKCKNYDLIKEICSNSEMKKLQIIIIGKNQEILSLENVSCQNYLDKKNINILLNNTKNVVIPSFYDSNPNVLVEAFSNGCNVITSRNVGNCNYINDECIVEKYNNINEWVKIILKCNKKYYYEGLSSKVIKYQLSHLFCYVIKKNNQTYSFNQSYVKIDAVGIYKLPAKWNLIKNISTLKQENYTYIKNTITNFNEHNNRKTDITSNIYLQIFKKLIEYKKFKNSHYIFVDESIKYCINFQIDNINIWILNTPQSVINFSKASFYFIRGTYHNFYQRLFFEKSYVIYYPATSIKFNYNIKGTNTIIKKNLKRIYTPKLNIKYDIVLTHEDNIYPNIYKNSQCIVLEKFASDNFKYINLPRIYDIIFIADAIQNTKNHQLMFELLRYCESICVKINICYISNPKLLQTKYNNFIDYKHLKYVNVSFFYNKTPKELNILFNQSKVNLILSGRDFCPRVISESLACGCYNIALDTLSDGKFYYNDIFGCLLSFEESLVKVDSGSLSYLGDNNIFNTLINIILKKYNHNNISKKSIYKYNINNLINSIKKYF